MKQILQTRLGQQLTLTPQLQQAIRLLQLSAQDLTEEIQKNLETNPLLELVEENDAPSPETAEAPESNSETPLTMPEISPQLPEPPTDTSLESSLEEFYAIEHDWEYPTHSPSEASSDLPFDIKDTRDNSLKERLLWQMRLTPFTEIDQAIALAIIDAINEAGYLSCSLGDIEASLGACRNNIDRDEIEAVLHRIQHFDPLGVGCQTLQDYLLLQLNQKPSDTPWLLDAKKLVTDHIDLLAKRDYKRLKQICQLKEPQVNAILKLIQSLNSRPNYEIADTEQHYIIPDVIVSRHQGRWVVELNAQCVPKIQVNSHYAALAGKARGASAEELKARLQEARWLVKSLANRNETLLKVATCIMEYQQEFLFRGDMAMKPLVLQFIAEKTQLHESTISRITHQKYIQTPVGVYELKYFFSSHLQGDTGEGHSSIAIRALVKKLIAAESPQKPFSDNRLALFLQQQYGIHIARRTVTKYREAMGILPSNERKNRELAD